MINATIVKELRNVSGCGMVQCKEALEICNGDFELALGYLKYDGCAVVVGDGSKEVRKKWLIESAEKYKRSLLC